MMREGIALALEAEGGIAVAGQASSGSEAIDAYLRIRPDVALVDLQMPGTDGLAAIRAIRSRDPEARLIVISTWRGDARIAAALKAGARAYVMKEASSAELADVVRAVHEGRYALPPALLHEIDFHYTNEVPSARELDVLRLVSCGRSNREIASVLCISETTVKSHVSSVIAKLGAGDRAHAVTLAVQRGFIRL
jgi:DNA-binding NarL/FixJ family response regulator